LQAVKRLETWLNITGIEEEETAGSAMSKYISVEPDADVWKSLTACKRVRRRNFSHN